MRAPTKESLNNYPEILQNKTDIQTRLTRRIETSKTREARSCICVKYIFKFVINWCETTVALRIIEVKF